VIICYRQAYIDAGIIPDGKLTHLISDAATMQIIRWTKGGFGMAAHNYDGDMLTDEIAQVHRSPGFITSNLIGKRNDGVMIKGDVLSSVVCFVVKCINCIYYLVYWCGGYRVEFEASHGTVSDLWHAHLRGEETSMNPLGMIEALIGALNHSADLQVSQSNGNEEAIKNGNALLQFTETLRKALHNTFRYGQGTRDMAGPEGLTTEKFIDKVAWRLGRYIASQSDDVSPGDIVIPSRSYRRNCELLFSSMSFLFLFLTLSTCNRQCRQVSAASIV
jgi:isocitrate dehydrogenase